MGYILESTEAMGEYSVEVRRESFYLRGASLFDHDFEGAPIPDHVIYLYPSSGPTSKERAGTVEIELRDIPKIRAALDAIEDYLKERP